MRIDCLSIQNFKAFEDRKFEFHKQFNLVVGINGSGKTSLLNALTVAVGAWAFSIKAPKDAHRNIAYDEIRRTLRDYGGLEVRFEVAEQAEIRANGWVPGFGDGFWTRYRQADGNTTWISSSKEKTNVFFKGINIVEAPQGPFAALAKGECVDLPLIAFYGCDRLWAPVESHLNTAETMAEQHSRLDGYKGCFHAYSSAKSLETWLQKQDIISYQEKSEPLGTLVLQKALANCLEGFERLSFMAKEGMAVVHFKDGRRVPFDDLSDGQRTVFSTIGDMVRRAVLMNPHLGSEVLNETPGVVLIDELDLHLHPRWQRRIIGDLRRTFPRIQFVCTTHSPQLIGQAKPGEIILLDAQGTGHPGQSYGMDSNWVLKHIMDSADRDPSVSQALDNLFDDIEEGRFDRAYEKLQNLRQEIGDHPELVEAEALIGRYTRFDSNTEG